MTIAAVSSYHPLSKSPLAHPATTPSHQFRPSGVYYCRPTAWKSLLIRRLAKTLLGDH